MYIALNASSKLTGVVGVGVTTVPVTAGTGTQFAVGSNHSYVTFQDATNKETCKITGQSGDNLTVVRTKALSWAIGTVIECRPCAEAMADYAVAPQIDGSAAKTTPVDADTVGLIDSAASSALKKVTWANVKATLKTYFDTLYRLVTDDVTLSAGKVVVFEGATDDAFETTLSVVDPTADNTLSLPNKSGTLAVTTDFDLAAVSGIGNGRATDITISSAGEVTMPLQPAFLAYNSATDSNVTGDNTSYTVVCDTEVFDQNGDYNSGTGVFTAPVSGRYRFTARALVAELASAHVTQEINLTTSNRTYSLQDVFGSNPYTQRQLEINVLADMDAGDTASFAVVIRSGSKVCDVYGSASGNFTSFAGELVA